MLNISVSKTLDYLKQEGHSDLAFFIEETWKNHPEKSTNKDDKSYEMWKEQLCLNLPVLYLASIRLHNFVQNRGIKHLLFATRDCVHWYKIYKALYPNEDIHYFHCSRNMFEGARAKHNQYFEAYVDNITGGDIQNSIYIDVHGTGKRMYDYFTTRKQKLPACFILSSGHSNSDGLSDGIKRLIRENRGEFVVFEASGSPIEMLNYDIIGSCYDYNQYGSVRLPLEYDIKYVEAYHKCAELFIQVIKVNKSRVIKNRDKLVLYTAIRYLYKPARDSLPIISQWISPERKHEVGEKIQ